MLKFWELVILWFAVGVLMTVAAVIWSGFIIMVGLLFALGLKLMGVI